MKLSDPEHVELHEMPQAMIDQHQRQNFFQTAMLLLAMTAILCLAGFLLGGLTGVFVAMGMLIFGLVFSPAISTQMLLRHYQAQRITREQAPVLLAVMDQISTTAGISPPPIYYIPTRLPNAFAAGLGAESFVAVTDGLLRLLNRRELAGVLAHEVAHIINHDIRVLGTADAITRTTALIARIGLFLVLFSGIGPMIGMSVSYVLLGGLVMLVAPAILIMLQLAISRTREFDADLGAAELTGDPAGLASALQKLNPPQATSLLNRIFNPGPRRTQPAMLRTHPPTAERVERLMELAQAKQLQVQPDWRHQLVGNTDPRPSALVAPSLPEVPPGEIVIVHPPVRRKPRYHPTTGLWH